MNKMQDAGRLAYIGEIVHYVDENGRCWPAIVFGVHNMLCDLSVFSAAPPFCAEAPQDTGINNGFNCWHRIAVCDFPSGKREEDAAFKRQADVRHLELPEKKLYEVNGREAWFTEEEAANTTGADVLEVKVKPSIIPTVRSEDAT